MGKFFPYTVAHADLHRSYHRTHGWRGRSRPIGRRRHRGGAQMAPVARHPNPPLAGGDCRHRPEHGRSANRPPRTNECHHAKCVRRHPRRRHSRLGAGRRHHLLGPWLRCPYTGYRTGRGGLLLHRHDRVSRDPDRSVLRRPDYHLHVSAYRQRRHQHRGHRGDHHRRPWPGGEAGHHRTLQLALHPNLAGLAAGSRHHRHRRGRYKGTDHPHS